MAADIEDLKICKQRIIVDLSGYSQKHIVNLTEQGVIGQSAPGKYDAVETLKKLRAWRDERPSATQSATSSLKYEQARKAKLANDQTESMLIKSLEVETLFHFAASTFAQSIENARRRIKTYVTDLDVKKKIDIELHEARHSVAKIFEDIASNNIVSVKDTDAAADEDADAMGGHK